MSTVIDFNDHENRINDIEYTLSDITGGGGYNYDLTSKIITVYKVNGVVVDNATEQAKKGVTIYPNNTTYNDSGNIYGVTLFGGWPKISATNRGVLLGGEINSDNSIFNYGVAMLGNTSNSATIGINGMCLLGMNAKHHGASVTIASDNYTLVKEAYSGIYICGNNATFPEMIYGNATFICNSNTTLSARSVCNSISGQSTKFNNYNILNGFRVMITTPNDAPIDNFQQRMGITIVGYTNTDFRADLNVDKTYKIYYPSHLNYSAQTYGYVRYTDKMNITDPDGEYIIKDGKLTLEERVKQLEQKIEHLIESLNN